MRLSLKSALTVVALSTATLFIATPAHADTISIEYEVTSQDLSVNTWPGGTGTCDTDRQWWALASKFYIEKELRVSETGLYTFTDERGGGFTEDAAMVILTSSLNPDDVSNCVYSIDDYAQVRLETGITYTVALSSFHRDGMGLFSYQAQGPGLIMLGNLAESELIIGPSSTDTDTQVVLTAAPVSNLLGADLSGIVTFKVNGGLVGEAPVDSATGEASLRIGNAFPVGTYTITADYSGVAGKTLPSSNTITMTTTATQTATTLDISLMEIIEGAQATYTATVSGINPTGNVEFYSGTVLVGIGQVTDGTASITVSPSAGTYNLTAHYVGDAKYTASSSTEKSLLVKPAVKPDQKPKTPTTTPLANTGDETPYVGAAFAATIALTSGLALHIARRKTVK